MHRLSEVHGHVVQPQEAADGDDAMGRVAGGAAVVVTTLASSQCSAALLESAARLMWATPEFAWAHNPVDGKVDRDMAITIARLQGEASQADEDVQSRLQWHVVRGQRHQQHGDDSVVACAKSFVRVVAHSHGKMPVLALGNVACSTTHRGQGLGKAVVQAAFARLAGDAELSHCLFETAVPSFYEKLGARLIEKTLVINSTGDKIAFEDEYVMVYPADRAWPHGTIDLLGPGY
eukprot:COSAG01_NODE_16602_length_1222_cov_1.480855_1_plen_234_part_00